MAIISFIIAVCCVTVAFAEETDEESTANQIASQEWEDMKSEVAEEAQQVGAAYDKMIENWTTTTTPVTEENYVNLELLIGLAITMCFVIVIGTAIVKIRNKAKEIPDKTKKLK